MKKKNINKVIDLIFTNNIKLNEIYISTLYQRYDYLKERKHYLLKAKPFSSVKSWKKEIRKLDEEIKTTYDKILNENFDMAKSIEKYYEL